MAKMPEALTVEEHLFTDDGRVPNNPSLPLIVYRAVLEPGPRAAAACEALFAGQLVQYDTWRYKQQTSHDTMYVARLILTFGPRQGLEVLAFSHGEAARAAMFELLGNLTLEDQ